MGDIPYTQSESYILESQIENLPKDAEFIIHVGDIMDAFKTFCPESLYSDMRSILDKSHAPFLILPGDNDWNDCPNPDVAWYNWQSQFITHPTTSVEQTQKWNRVFSSSVDSKKRVHRPNTPDATNANFCVMHKGVLFVGVNVVGGTIHDVAEWEHRHEFNLQWMKYYLDLYTGKDESSNANANGTDGEEKKEGEQEEQIIRAVIIFGHAFPKKTNKDFFIGMIKLLHSYGFNNRQVLYVHGDGHYWMEHTWRSLPCIQVDMGKRAPLLKFNIKVGSGDAKDEIIVYDRRLDEGEPYHIIDNDDYVYHDHNNY